MPAVMITDVLATGSAVMASRANNIRIILASASPRRADLLRLTGWDFSPSPVDLDETAAPEERANDVALRLAKAKAEAAWRAGTEIELLLAADTLVVDGDEILGKPGDEREARRMLGRLRGRNHRVISALALRSNSGEETEICETYVPMREYTDSEIAAYVDTRSPMDKAGAYGIQDRDFNPVDIAEMHGCFANVMGLPLCHLLRAMRRLGLDSCRDVPLACQAFTSYDCHVYSRIQRGGN
jgi:MAF protein